ncbi:hypothetical protein [Streptococcus pyogenes]|uniref:hypothetical protein n=1 Tax=Streptococcus pyogenes TaxID=1314 RepID=UPI00109D6FDB|nr:hypothetical protein [Streptococcus pyogenes]HER4824219.1 hypothetical protein [Streptococcus pyogenes NGAS015]NSX76017.1 hypothetical protein [Streptococcus pyogenes]NTS70654.1 hypothetical protein [Streptococcus pyogenes]HEP1357781.1 hypothetical protein [Streptococcus pyogenes]HER6672714.1 hypothetical protein [Streptococcus pyogenes]
MENKKFIVLALYISLVSLCVISQPVSAELVPLNDSPQSQLMTGSEEEKLDQAHLMGETQGLEDGRNGKSKKNRMDSRNNPQGIDETELSDYWDSYESSYDEGYKQWSDEHPVEATLSWIWETITSWVQSIF